MTEGQMLALLKSVNMVLVEVDPMIGAAVSIGSLLVQRLRSSGNTTGEFAAEIAKFDAATGRGLAADAAWRAEHGVPTPGEPTTPG